MTCRRGNVIVRGEIKCSCHTYDEYWSYSANMLFDTGQIFLIELEEMQRIMIVGSTKMTRNGVSMIFQYFNYINNIEELLEVFFRPVL